MPPATSQTRIAVTGAGGQLGSQLCRQLGPRAWPLTHAELDVTDSAAVARVLAAGPPEGGEWSAVINTAAYTRVDAAESDREACRRLNALAVGHLADACRARNCLLVQISTDYVFDDPSATVAAWRETDPPHPRSVYAQTKLEGECLAADWRDHLVIRTCGLYGHPHRWHQGPNFVDTMLRLAAERPVIRVVDDQRCTPSFTRHVARAILYLVEQGQRGTFHLTQSGGATWHEVAAEILRLRNLPVRLEKISTVEYGAAAPRPANSVLSTARYQALGGPALPDWKLALAEYLSAAEP